jgi:hypothetical protein
MGRKGLELVRSGQLADGILLVDRPGATDGVVISQIFDFRPVFFATLNWLLGSQEKVEPGGRSAAPPFQNA